MRRFPKSRDLNWRPAYTTGDGGLAPPSAPDSDSVFHAPGTGKFLFSGVPHPSSPDAQRMTAHELGLWDRLEREACTVEAYALTPFYLTEYLRAETGYEVAGLSGLLPGLIQGLKVLAATTAAGAAAGAVAGTPFFGVGAVPGAIFGAEAGLDAGLYLLFLAGLPALAEYVAANIGKIVELFQRGTGIAWNAPDSPLVQAEVERAARCFAQGVAIWVRIVLEAVVLYLIGKGAAGAARRLAGEMRGAGYGALADTVEAEGSSLVGNPKLQPKSMDAGEGTGGDAEPSQAKGGASKSGPKETSAPRKAWRYGAKQTGRVEPGAVPDSPRLQADLRESQLRGAPDTPPGWPEMTDDAASTFGAAPKPMTFPEGTKLYRVIDNSGSAAGGHWTLDPPPATEAAWRGSSAVKDAWNGDGGYVMQTVGPEGLKAWSGPAAPQAAAVDGYVLPGGGNQVWVPPGTIGGGAVPKPTPWNLSGGD